MNPITDYQLAHEADEREINRVFAECPWLVNLHVNGAIITRSEWEKKRKEKK